MTSGAATSLNHGAAAALSSSGMFHQGVPGAFRCAVAWPACLPPCRGRGGLIPLGGKDLFKVCSYYSIVSGFARIRVTFLSPLGGSGAHGGKQF